MKPTDPLHLQDPAGTRETTVTGAHRSEYLRGKSDIEKWRCEEDSPLTFMSYQHMLQENVHSWGRCSEITGDSELYPLQGVSVVCVSRCQTRKPHNLWALW